ncbi:MAG: hypothetical protein AB1442_13490 [Nitrospirota bacterium]
MMKNNHSSSALFVLAFFLGACDYLPQLLPQPLPTYTNAPTYTPYPTYTALPSPTISGSPQPVATPDPASRFSAIAVLEKIQFWFRINPSITTWEWNTVPDNYLEYEWAVMFPLEANGVIRTYTLSLSKLVQVNTKQPEQGTLEDLLSICELELLAQDDFSLYPSPTSSQGIAYRVENGGILIELTKADIVQLFYSTRPSYVLFDTNSSNSSVPYAQMFVKVYYP